MIELYWEQYNYVTPNTHALIHIRMVRLHSATEDYPMGVFFSEVLAIHADEEDSAANIITARGKSGSDDPLWLKTSVHKMLGVCQTHEQFDPNRVSELPTRLIDVTSNPDREYVSLVETIGKAGIYIALSYTWGSRNNEQSLTSKTTSAWKKNMPLSTLPRTIQDAIVVARMLKVQYVWVDALCIMQDCDADKNHEIPRMLDIYGNATLVIVAACAVDAAHGFLGAKTPPVGAPSTQTCGRDCDFHFRLPVRVEPGVHGIFVTHCLEHVMYDESIEAVNARAWTLQEQVIARRCLLFNSNTVQWRCGAGTLNLDNSIHLPRNYNHNKAGSSLEELGQPVSNDSTAALIQWLHTVEVYSHRALSMSKDRLTAVSGLARRFAPHIASEYLAGIWSLHILHQLCWAKDETSDHQKAATCIISTSYRAPSWSWASTNTGVEFILPQQNFVVMYNMRFWWAEDPESIIWPGCQIVERSIHYQQDDPFGDAKHAHITIRATYREAWIVPSTSMLLWQQHTDRTYVTADQAHNRIQHLIDVGYDMREEPHEMYSPRCYRLDKDAADDLPLPVSCIALLCNSSQAFGLLIQRHGPHWIRVGLFHNFAQSDFDQCEQRDFKLE